ncbi:MAG: trypsin-like peptidase domain-containing protein [Pegethrix bostrychoides GSE-TBD4-15B]|jgi:S1-C subfamily serine protease|uniref:Trypsin-like peptidase domain-containing protein n=1 Tax=Pegethrix bostrychoides GSE-TBD4-15B TaxID=2839662 RepID=A0A951PGL6_9CYAN|nr:trypsin-like peptidase domain-containing protein [Pegethrix bostrychoides GSE-TBD4-15B]
MASSRQILLYTTLLVAGGGIGWAGTRSLQTPQQRISNSLPATYQIPAVAPQSSQPVSPNFIVKAVERVGPAVVRIDASRKVANALDSENPILKRFFGENQLRQFEDRVEQGTGSGFIVSADGHVITNAHVVERADTVNVTLKDGRVLEGRVVGIDPVTDVAAIKVAAAGLPTVSLSKSKQIAPGEWAIAIGNPLGLDNTVTAGIVSAIGRSSSQVGIPDRRVQFIQTDAAINPGNSGGPLLNGQGEVIGINTAIRADAQGLGFAIPIDTGWKIAQELFKSGKAQHPYLGIQMVDLTPELRQQINEDPDTGLTISSDRGVLIIQVIDGAPAEAAGLKQGDVILKLNNTEVTTASELQEKIETVEIGEPLSLAIRRRDEVKTLQIRPVALPTQQGEGE